MQTIVNWIIKQATSGMNQVYTMFINSTMGGFDSVYVQAILKICSYLTTFIIAIAFFIAVISFFTGKMEDKNVSFITIIKNGFIAIALSFFGFDMAKAFYFIAGEFAKNIVAVLQYVNSANAEVNASDWIGNAIGVLLGDPEVTVSLIVMLVLSIGILIVMFKNVFDIIRRFGVYFLSTMMLPIYIFEYITGDSQAITKWMRQLGAILLTHICQMTAINLGIMMLGGSSVEAIAGYSFLFASGYVEKICSNWGFSTKQQGSNLLMKISSALTIKGMFARG